MTKKHKTREFEGLASLESLLDQSGARDEILLRAFKRGFALQLDQAMKVQHLSKAAMAKRMGTSRAQLDRVLDPDAHNVTLETLSKAAHSLGMKLQVALI